MPRVNQVPISRKVKTASTVAPVKGLNTRDPLQSMEAHYAVAISNFIATPQGLQVREGFTKNVTGITGWVQSFMTYKGANASFDRLFACAGSRIYDATNPTATPVAVQSGLLGALWQHANMATPGGRYLIASNGMDTARFYDGAVWKNFVLAATPNDVGQINSATMTNLDDWKQVLVHQRRIWITHPNSSVCHFLDVNSIGGNASRFDFGANFSRGGVVATLATLSQDVGFGLEQLLVVTSTTGEIVLYAGTNPAVAETWAFRGAWAGGEPVGLNSSLPWHGDLLTLTQDGINELSTQLKSGRIDNAAELSTTIQPTISGLVRDYSTLPGFQMITFPGKNLLIVNVPQINAEASFQFVYNTITKGWTQFTGWPAQCWAYLNGNMYFGGNGYVAKAFQGYKDRANGDGSGGDSYTAFVQQAFDYFELPGQNKAYRMARCNLSTATATPMVSIGCNVDFNLQSPSGTMSTPPSTGNVWDVARWNSSSWGYGGQNYQEWAGISGIGYCAGLTMAISVNNYTIWTSTDWVYEPGGVIG